MVEPVTLLMTDVPLFVIFPVASGVPADGRTWMPDQVMALTQVLDDERVMEMVMVVWVGVTVCEVAPLICSGLDPPQLPLTLLRVAVTLLVVVLKTKPDGTFNMIVPVPISPVAPSVRIGPVSEVKVPPVVSAEIAEPPVAGVTVAAANVIRINEKATVIAAAAGRSVFERRRSMGVLDYFSC